MLSGLEAAALAVVAVPAGYLYTTIESAAVRGQLAAAAGVSFVAFLATLWLVPLFGRYLARRGLRGKDMGRRGTPKEHEEM